MDTILIIGGRLEAIHKAKDLGLRVVLLQHKERLLPGQTDAADAVLLVDYLDWERTKPLVKAAHEAYGFTAVMTLIEQATELAGRINDLLGLGGTSYEVAARFHDKQRMRAWLAETGFESVGCATVAGADDIRGFGAVHGWPVVVKPLDGTASRGIAIVGGPDEADAEWKRLAALRGREDLPMATFYPVTEYIAEEYLDGTEYSVESFSFAGRHIVVNVTGKFQEGVVEVGHMLPAIIDPAEEQVITDYIGGFLTAMGLRDGIAHTEVRLTAGGPRIIESHDRAPGDRLLDIMVQTHGVDLEQYASGWPLRKVPELTERPERIAGVATKWINGEPGIVTAVEGVDEVLREPHVLWVDVHVEVGDVVTAMDDNFARHVQLFTTDTTTAGAVARCDEVIDRIRVVTRPLTA